MVTQHGVVHNRLGRVRRHRPTGGTLSGVRIVLVSDLHYDLRKLDWVLARAAEVDVVVIAGDLLDVAGAVPLDAQITVVLGYLERLAALGVTLVCSGNHDLDHRTDAGEKATAWITEAAEFGVVTDGASLDIDGCRFTSCAWWEGPETLATLERQLADAGVDRPDRWVWIFHGPPEGPLSWTGSRHFGDPELPRLLETHQPDLVLCGHIHEAPYTDEGSWAEWRDGTWLFNSGYQRGEIPAFVEIDLDEDKAYWWSLVGTGEVDLSDPSTAPPAVAVQ